MKHGVFESSNRISCLNCRHYYQKNCKIRNIPVNQKEVCMSSYISSFTGNPYSVELKYFGNNSPKYVTEKNRRTRRSIKYIPYITNAKKKKNTSHHNKNPESFYSSKEWRSLRVKALLKYGRKCCLCGRSVSDGVILHVDHIKPRSKYPWLELKLSNLQILCEDCNMGKSNNYQDNWK